MVKANVTDFIVAQGMRSAAAMAKDTPVTWPPSEPEDTPALIESLLVLTVMPLTFPAVAGPNVTPLRVTTYAPAEKVLPTPIDMEDVETEDTVNNRPGAVAVVGGAANVGVGLEEQTALKEEPEPSGPGKHWPLGSSVGSKRVWLH